jgi:hypothetical protein
MSGGFRVSVWSVRMQELLVGNGEVGAIGWPEFAREERFGDLGGPCAAGETWSLCSWVIEDLAPVPRG